MFNRNMLKDLEKWSADVNRKPLILRGARQVGKTTLIREFARQYDFFLEFNLEIKTDRDLFTKEYSIDDLITALHFQRKQLVQPHAKTLIFIDEIQYSPEAAIYLRYFYEQRNEFHVVAAGSLLESLLNRTISFPVGRVEYKFLFPLSFVEYLMASRETAALEMIHRRPCPDFAHDQLLKLFHHYALVGGMPEAIAVYLLSNDILAVNKVYQNLTIAFMDDVVKYAHGHKNAEVIRHAIAHSPLHAGTRIKFAGFGQSNYQSREMSEALRALEKAMLLRLMYPTLAVTPPAELDHRKSPKLIFLDTGMVNYSVGLQHYYFSLQDLNSLYLGKISENIVGQELLASGLVSNELRFWVRENPHASAEVDYVVPFGPYLIPIEVKSGATGTLRSLIQFMERADHPYAVRLYAGKIKEDTLKTPSGRTFNLLNLPYYLTGQLKEYLAEWVQWK